jgi:hypothetical protein
MKTKREQLIEKLKKYTKALELMEKYHVDYDITELCNADIYEASYNEWFEQQPQKVEEEEEKPTDKMIENYFKSQHYDNKNGHHYRVNKDRIFGAKAMRDNPEQFKDK